MNYEKIGAYIAEKRKEKNIKNRVIIFHRVVKVLRDEEDNTIKFITRGNINNINDTDAITKDLFLGKVEYVFIGKGRIFYTNNGIMPKKMFICFVIAIFSILYIDFVQLNNLINKKI